MTVLNDTVNKLIRDTVNLILGIPNFAIKAKQVTVGGAPRPIGPYAAVDFLSNINVGWEQHRFSDESATEVREDVAGMREIAMSIGFYRDDSIDNANAVRTGLVRESIQSLFTAAGIGLTRRSDVRDIAEQLENGWEERAQFDVFLSAVGTDTDIINNILSVDIEGQFQTRDLIYNIDIEVN